MINDLCIWYVFGSLYCLDMCMFFHDYDLMYLVAIYGAYVFGMDLWISMNYGCLVSFL